MSIEKEEVVQGRLLKETARYENSTFMLLNVYTPVNPVERCVFLEKNCKHSYRLRFKRIFNWGGGGISVVLLTTWTGIIQSKKVLKQIIETYELADVWCSKDNTDRQYLWAHARDNYIFLATLDRFYCFEQHLQIFRSRFLCPVGFSARCLLVGNAFMNGVKPRSAY